MTEPIDTEPEPEPDPIDVKSLRAAFLVTASSVSGLTSKIGEIDRKRGRQLVVAGAILIVLTVGMAVFLYLAITNRQILKSSAENNAILAECLTAGPLKDDPIVSGNACYDEKLRVVADLRCLNYYLHGKTVPGCGGIIEKIKQELGEG